MGRKRGGGENVAIMELLFVIDIWFDAPGEVYSEVESGEDMAIFTWGCETCLNAGLSVRKFCTDPQLLKKQNHSTFYMFRFISIW